MRGYPQFSFWISITLVKICFSRIFSKPRKNTFELVGTALNLGENLSSSADVLHKISDLAIHVVILQTTAKKWTKLKNARPGCAKLLFWPTKYQYL